MNLAGEERDYAEPHHPGVRPVCCATVVVQATGASRPSFLAILLRPHMAMSHPTLQPPVTPACVSSPFGWRHAVGPHAPAGFHNRIDLPEPAGALGPGG